MPTSDLAEVNEAKANRRDDWSAAINVHRLHLNKSIIMQWSMFMENSKYKLLQHQVKDTAVYKYKPRNQSRGKQVNDNEATQYSSKNARQWSKQNHEYSNNKAEVNKSRSTEKGTE
jgi:hypothetical protein